MREENGKFSRHGLDQYAGFVTTQAFGQAVLFRIEVPKLNEREVVLRGREYDAEGRYLVSGSKVRKGAVGGVQQAHRRRVDLRDYALHGVER